MEYRANALRMTTVAIGWSHHGYSGAYECEAVWSAMGTVRMPDLRYDSLVLLRSAVVGLLPSPRLRAAALRRRAAHVDGYRGRTGEPALNDPCRGGVLPRRRPRHVAGARPVVRGARQDEEQVREPVDEPEQIGVDGRRCGQRHDVALGAANDRPGDVQRRPARRAAG